jgi:hypothetical protein
MKDVKETHSLQAELLAPVRLADMATESIVGVPGTWSIPRFNPAAPRREL